MSLAIMLSLILTNKYKICNAVLVFSRKGIDTTGNTLQHI